MSLEKDKLLTDEIKRQLDRHADAVDELTSSRLQGMRKTALQNKARPGFSWLPVTGWAGAAAAVLTVLVLSRAPDVTNGLPGDPDLLAQVEDLELIEELEFYAWLEDTESNS